VNSVGMELVDSLLSKKKPHPNKSSKRGCSEGGGSAQLRRVLESYYTSKEYVSRGFLKEEERRGFWEANRKGE